MPADIQTKVNAALYKNVIEKPVLANYTDYNQSNRKNNGLSLLLIYHFFHLTNPVAFQNGEKPIYRKKGPYVFEKFAHETNVQVWNNGKFRSSRKIGVLEFKEGASSPNRLDDMITFPNLFTALFMKICQPTFPGLYIKHKFGIYCHFIAKNGFFEQFKVEEMLYGMKLYGIVPFRINNGHKTCHKYLETCKQGWLQKEYSVENNAQFSSNLNAKKMFEQTKTTGYGDPGCMEMLDFAKHGLLCSKGKDMHWSKPHGLWAFNYLKNPPKAQPVGSYAKWDMKDPKVGMFYKTMWKWYDETPYDNSDNLKMAESYSMAEHDADPNTKGTYIPCKWDGSTNKIKGCPKMHFNNNYGLIHPLFHNPRMNQEPIYFQDVIFRRKSKLVFEKKDNRYGANVFKYTYDPETFKGSEDNAQFGMPAAETNPPFKDFPGDGAVPIQRVLNNIPFVITLPHWHLGGAKAQKWTSDLGLREPVSSRDAFSIYYEPMTGVPFETNIKYQQNIILYPSTLKLKGANADKSINETIIVHDFENIKPEQWNHLYNEKYDHIDMSKVGAYKNCEKGASNPNGCHVMIPYLQLELKFVLSPALLEKLKKLVVGLGKVKGIQRMLYIFFLLGVMILICLVCCLAYHYLVSGKKDGGSGWRR